MIDELSMHICDTPNYTDGPCYACAKEKVEEWVFNRYENCIRLAKEKKGEDKQGWMEDADHFMFVLNLLKTPLHASQKLNHFAKQNLEWANRCAELTSELSTLRGAAEEMKIVLGEAYIILAGLHEETDWEIAPIIRVKMAEVAKQAESALARYQAIKKG